MQQAALEPSNRYGVGYLEALRSTLAKQGQFRYKGPMGLWRQLADNDVASQHAMTECLLTSSSGQELRRNAGEKGFVGQASEAGYLGMASQAGSILKVVPKAQASEAGYLGMASQAGSIPKPAKKAKAKKA